MENQPNLSKQTSHLGGDIKFWRDDMVQEYERKQSLLWEKRGELFANIVRVVNYFRELRSITAPKILDIGCGPGIPTTSSTYILEKVPSSTVVGVDSSEQMIEAAKSNLIPKYGQRFSGFVSNFNTDMFWIPEIDDTYDFIVSSGALHYVSDKRRAPFLKEIFDHIKDDGALVCSLGNRSAVNEIADMTHLFRLEFTYDQLDKGKRPQDFQKFKESFEETDAKANINWHSRDTWLDAMRRAGFKGADVVWHLWIRSIFVAVK